METQTTHAGQSSPSVSILIANWNGREHLETCLESLAAQTFRDFETILVDNGSSDGSVAFVRQRFPWVRLVELKTNTGFAGANNIGLAHAAGDYLVTLNNDTRAEPGWLGNLVGAADSDPRVGMVASRICAFDDPDRIDSLGLKVSADAMARGAFRRCRYSLLQMSPREEILLPSACAALYKRAMLDETGFFDEDFFAYCEDTDLGLRGRLAGWRALLATDAVVYHKYSMTGGVFSPFKLRLIERNHYWVALKCFPLPLLLLLPATTLGRYLEQAKAVFAGRGSGGEFRAGESKRQAIGALLRGMAESLIKSPAILLKRRRIQSQRKISGRAMVRLLRQHRLSFRELLDLTS